MLLKTYFMLAALVCVCAGGALHSTLDDNHDLGAVVANADQLRAFTLCFVNKGPCNELTESFRKNMPEAVPEACARCTTGQKHMLKIYLDGLETYAPDLYAMYSAFYDPKGKYMANLRKALAPFKIRP